MTTSHGDVGALLAQVGIIEQADSELAPGISAKTYQSDYARVYIADCGDARSHDWAEVVRMVDRKVLQDMRIAELSGGGVIDSHVCFIVSEHDDPTAWVQRNEHLVRQVSRKYWIKRSRVQHELENRLTLLPVTSAPALWHTDHAVLSTDDRAWLARLTEDGPATLFAEFISRVEGAN